MSGTVHTVKAVPPFFEAYFDGSKPWSLRRNDRDYQDGDVLNVGEWLPGSQEWTGNTGLLTIVKVWRDLPHLPADFVILTVKPGLPNANLDEGGAIR